MIRINSVATAPISGAERRHFKRYRRLGFT
jgi:hypothetical protein